MDGMEQFIKTITTKTALTWMAAITLLLLIETGFLYTLTNQQQRVRQQIPISQPSP